MQKLRWLTTMELSGVEKEGWGVGRIRDISKDQDARIKQEASAGRHGAVMLQIMVVRWNNKRGRRFCIS